MVCVRNGKFVGEDMGIVPDKLPLHPMFRPEVKVFKWHQCNDLDEMQAFYESIIPAIREAAKECGYAIGVHGSMRRDLDLIAAPWNDCHTSPTTLAVEIQKAATGGLSINSEHIKWEKKPCGRLATSLSACWINWPDAKDGTGHIDLSVMASV